MGTTLLDVAKKVGVSRTTVSNAFNDPTQLSTERRDEILAAARELGYPGPNPAARAVRRGRVGVIGMVFNESLTFALEDPFVRGLLSGLATELADADYGLLLLPINTPDSDVIRGAIVDGIVGYRLKPEDAILETAAKRGLSVVRLGTLSSKPGDVSVSIDEVGGARLAAEHLVSLGHRRFFVLLDMTEDLVLDQPLAQQFPFEEQRLRWQGYAAVGQAAGVEVIPVAAGRNVERAGQNAVNQLLESTEVTAIAAITDVLALGALRALREHGLGAGVDVSVVGFDNIGEAQDAGLTTVAQPIIERGQTAGRLVLSEEHQPQSEILPCTLIVRDTTGPAPRRTETYKEETS